MSLAKVLVIDDLFGRALRERRNLCKAYRLVDVTGDDDDAHVPQFPPIARAVFCSGQRVEGGRLRNSVEAALEVVRAGWPDSEGEYWALCLLDLRFNTGDEGGRGNTNDDDFGLVVLEHLRRTLPHLPVVILSSRERADVIQACRQLGAADFIQRHDQGDELPYAVLARKLHEYALLADARGLIVGRSVPLLMSLAAARRAATGVGNILLLGESGTGKELVARYVHDTSPCAAGPYKVFDAFGTAESLQEDLLFGHERGAFTGAMRDRRGLFEEADGGTLFVDEVAEISMAMQNRLLRPIESRRVMRQGSSAEIALSYQLILATNKDLDDYARTERFKSDLLNRINAYTIWLPPLRERSEDIPLLARQLLERLCRDNGLRWPREIDARAMRRLAEHDWRDGNVRELRSALERAAKDNPQSEILVESDLRLGDEGLGTCIPPARASAPPPVMAPSVPAIEQGASYDELFGCWPALQKEVALKLLARLQSALVATARRSARDGTARLNLAGAVGCLRGCKVSTAEAADFVKRLVRFDPQTAAEAAARHPLLDSALTQARRTRTMSDPRASDDTLETNDA